MPTALITGATAGIGAAFARKLAADGFSLVLVAREERRLAAAADALRRGYGVDVETLAADLTSEKELATVEDRLHAGVDLLVNNAGFGHRHAALQMPVADQVAMLRLHCEAVARLTMAALPGIRARGRGGVVNVASVAAYFPYGPYSASKAWVVNFSEALAVQIPERRVHVMALCPGFVRTEFHRRASIDTGAIPGFLWLSADRVAAAAMRDFARGLPVSVPDVRYKAIAGVAKYVPRGVVRAVAGMLGRVGPNG
ncbi:SDR family NAD(P)-dependent oxidoreductase [Sphaerisporangium sp. TRM90804]|uniref:SDR family NAD(P)-dependent oxidoreductase n=1 Tax=Sphaerisporangium sp. TRM90804 TaxID=3031113 RepID=UPI0024488139|nr:SDR family NAD(P)-dependent oxidoreductase [Sphaerisporangium sp. TRM90804]MDH2424121.1 SDR family NAD(P)-dependent oxidoreductase [Sphaerisporangium sp. TRM90804]